MGLLNSAREATQLQRNLVGLLQAFCLTAPKEVGQGTVSSASHVELDVQAIPLLALPRSQTYSRSSSPKPSPSMHQALCAESVSQAPCLFTHSLPVPWCPCPHFMSEKTTERSKALCCGGNRSSLICLSFRLVVSMLTTVMCPVTCPTMPGTKPDHSS